MSRSGTMWRSAAWLAAGFVVASALAPHAAAGLSQVAVAAGPNALPLDQMFVYFFVMLGPFNVLPVFTEMTSRLERDARRAIAKRAFALACAGGVVAASVGQFVLAKWRVSHVALLVALGLVLLLVALRGILQEYRSARPHEPPERAAPSMSVAVTPIAFPGMITPQGVAMLILALAAGVGFARDAAILGLFLGVMVLDLITMIFARQLLGFIGTTALRMLMSVMGVLLLALAIQILGTAFVLLNLTP
jgi:multiple antibiotic resistance protein